MNLPLLIFLVSLEDENGFGEVKNCIGAADVVVDNFVSIFGG